jgi:hypothetical protein
MLNPSANAHYHDDLKQVIPLPPKEAIFLQPKLSQQKDCRDQVLILILKIL